jgi:hypothetical protein
MEKARGPAWVCFFDQPWRRGRGGGFLGLICAGAMRWRDLALFGARGWGGLLGSGRGKMPVVRIEDRFAPNHGQAAHVTGGWMSEHSASLSRGMRLRWPVLECAAEFEKWRY